jgi:hypothetical protein
MDHIFARFVNCQDIALGSVGFVNNVSKAFAVVANQRWSNLSVRINTNYFGARLQLVITSFQSNSYAIYADVIIAVKMEGIGVPHVNTINA